MNGRLKAYEIIGDGDGPEKAMVVFAESPGKAKEQYEFNSYAGYTDIHARRISWMDEYGDIDDPDAMMALLRHGWNVSLGGFISEDSEDKDVNIRRIEEYADRHDVGVETVFRMIAGLIGAAYPDRYTSAEGQEKHER